MLKQITSNFYDNLGAYCTHHERNFIGTSENLSFSQEFYNDSFY